MLELAQEILPLITTSVFVKQFFSFSLPTILQLYFPASTETGFFIVSLQQPTMSLSISYLGSSSDILVLSLNQTTEAL